MWFDSHCHLPYRGLEDVDSVLAEARVAGVGRFVTVGTDAEQSRAAIGVAAHHDDVWATVGLHPHDASNGVETIVELLDSPRVVAVGECGLDYHYDHSPRPVQREAFEAQIGMAHDRELALVVHTREAWEDTFTILGSVGAPDRTVFHCFTGGPDEARRALDLGAVLSFSGIVTFPNAAEVRGAAEICPLDRVLVETDSPYLAPVPNRGKTNRPAWVTFVGSAIAELKGIDPATVEQASTENAARVFALDPLEV